jgi:hypothetical protein
VAPLRHARSPRSTSADAARLDAAWLQLFADITALEERVARARRDQEQADFEAAFFGPSPLAGE